jgi:alpha-amylase
MWPGTYELCHAQRWLERFVAALDENPWIEVRTPRDAVDRHRPIGLAYLPTASYHEMQEWALPPASQERYHRAAARLEPEFGDEAHDLLRGGHWRGFIARYPEANRLHKRSLRASRLLHGHPSVTGDGPSFLAKPSAAWMDARTHLWRAQCNCTYWHGVFGGLYLPHLRSAAYRELIATEAFLAAGSPRTERSDLDLDGDHDGLLEAPDWAAWISERGARMWAFDDRRGLCNYGDTLARRPEFYHRLLDEARLGFDSGESIHAGVRLKEPGLAELARQYDRRGRDSFLDRWIESARDHDLANRRWAWSEPGDARLSLTCAEGDAPGLRKDFQVAGDGSLEVVYTLTSDRPRSGRLEVDLNIGLHVPHADDRYVEVDGRRADPPHLGASAEHAGVARSAFVDEWAQHRLDVSTDRRASLARTPVETVSLSEGGAERVFQGVEARYGFAVALEPSAAWTVRFRLAPGRAGDGA